jgi:hypothetical protein
MLNYLWLSTWLVVVVCVPNENMLGKVLWHQAAILSRLIEHFGAISSWTTYFRSNLSMFSILVGYSQQTTKKNKYVEWDIFNNRIKNYICSSFF